MTAMILKMAINLRSTESWCEAIKLFALIREVENPTQGPGCHIVGLVINPGLSVWGLSVGTKDGEAGGVYKVSYLIYLVSLASLSWYATSDVYTIL